MLKITPRHVEKKEKYEEAEHEIRKCRFKNRKMVRSEIEGNINQEHKKYKIRTRKNLLTRKKNK